MSEWNKLRGRTAFLLAAGVFAFSAAAGADELGLCADDEMVVIGQSAYETTQYYAYDDLGKRIGRIPGSDFGAWAKLVKKNSLFQTVENGCPGVFRTADMRVIAEYPEDLYSLSVFTENYVTIDRQTGAITLYDIDARPVAETFVSGWFDPAGYSYVELLSFEDEWFLSISQDEDEYWIRIRRADGDAGEVTDEALLRYLCDPDLSANAMGELLVFCPYLYAAEDRTGAVTTLDGEVVMDGIKAMLQEKNPGNPMDALYLYSYYSGSASKAAAVLQMNGDGYDVYDASLSYLGTLREIPDRDAMSGGFVQGLSFPELSGSVCEGFLFDCARHVYCPYAEGWDEYLIWTDGHLVRVPAWGVPEYISDAYYVASTDEETRVWRLEDMSLFAESNRIPNACLSLGSSGIALDDDLSSEEWWESTATIYDNDGNPTYHSANPDIHAFNNGTWYVSRGIYHGVIDLNGNWIIRDTSETE